MSSAQPGDTVRVHYTGSLGDGTVFDSSREGEPLEFTIGQHSVIPGFENAVVGLDVGAKKTVTLPPHEAYGHHQAERVIEMERSKLPAKPDPEPGMLLKGQMPEGPILFRIISVGNEVVTLDANHPLAGEHLTFELELIAIVPGADA